MMLLQSLVSDQEFFHFPVLLDEVISYLVNERTNLFVDATLGCGGHSEEILKRFENVRIIGIDVDEEELKIAEKRLQPFKERITILRENYRNIDKVIREMQIDAVDGVLFDLGVSSYQLNSNRGFSFFSEDFLDMRMDTRNSLTAYQIVNTYPQKKLVQILKEYGDEREAFRIAKAIVARRKLREIKTAKELAEIVKKSKRKRGRIHPATTTFQALRMEVNAEVENLKEGLMGAIKILRKGGRIGVISFHSIEDRIVKMCFRGESSLKIITKKPITPKREEILNNPRSRSAKLRVAEKI